MLSRAEATDRHPVRLHSLLLRPHPRIGRPSDRGPIIETFNEFRGVATATHPLQDVLSRSSEMAAFAEKAYGLNVLYLGGCCGSAPQHIRAIAGASGRRPEASRYSPDLSKHYALGVDPSLKQWNRDYADKL